jgi:hypothetical protein
MHETTLQIYGYTYFHSSSKNIPASLIISLNEWYFISYVLNSKTGYIYVNGNQVATGTLPIPNDITRASNYIGKSNWQGYIHIQMQYTMK